MLLKDKKVNIFEKLANKLNPKDNDGTMDFIKNNTKDKLNKSYKEALNFKLTMIINMKLINGVHYLKTILKQK